MATEAEVKRRDGPRLADVLPQIFARGQEDDKFAGQITGLTTALTNAPAAFVFDAEADLLAASDAIRPPEEAMSLAAEILGAGADSANRSVSTHGVHAGLLITLPSGAAGVLIIKMPAGGTMAGALALERLTLLSAISHASFDQSETGPLERVVRILSGNEVELEEVAAAVQVATDADYAAIARLSGEQISELSISGQPVGKSRAALPEKLRADMTALVQSHTRGRHDAVARGSAGTYAIKLETPRRNPELGTVVVQALSGASGAVAGRRSKLFRRLLRVAVAAALLCAAAFIPVPDGRRISAEVKAVEERVATAPFAGVLSEVLVRENDPVVAGETVLVRLDNSRVSEELIAAQADYGKALLERETARAGRDAAALRNAELEAERLRARIRLLEMRQASASIVAPISGLVSGSDLGDLQGATVRQGDTLLRVIDPAALRLSLEITDEDVGDLDVSAKGIFRPDFDPSLTYEARVTSISPAMDERDGIAVFSGRADFVDDTQLLSPGLRGVLSVDRDVRPVWSVVWEGLRNWALLRLWY